MAVPTFNGIALCTDAARYTAHCAETRLVKDTISGISGCFVQSFGTGSRKIVVEGVIKTSGESPSAARNNLMIMLREKTSLADGRTTAEFSGTDSTVFEQCLLRDYAHDDIFITSEAETYCAVAKIKAELLQVVT